MASEVTVHGARQSKDVLPLGLKLSSLIPLGREKIRRHDSAGFKWMREALVRTREALQTLSEAEELHRLLFENVPHPRFVCDGSGLRILAVNEAAVRSYGYSRAEFLRMKVTDLSPEGTSEFKDFCTRLSSPKFLGNGRLGRVFTHRRKDGKPIDIEIDAAPIPLRGSMQGRRVFLLLAQDVTEKRRAEQRLRAQHATTCALAESSTMTEASSRIFQAICENLGCDWGELWRVDPSARVLHCTQVWHPRNQRLRTAKPAARNRVFVCGGGIPGTVWARNKPVWIADVTRHPELQRSASVDQYGLRAVFAFPIRLNREVLGVITIFSRRVLPPDRDLLHLLEDICSQIGQVMGRRRAERQLLEITEREQQRIGRDLHDGLCQQLAGIAYTASDLQSKLEKRLPPEAVIAARIAELSRATAVQARQIARGLNPVKLGTTGLMAALNELTSAIQAMFSISCRFEASRPVHVRDHGTAVHLYRIVQEAIHNAVTHGKATEIVVSLRRQRDNLVLAVIDNGCGIGREAADGEGMGLENMKYRARAIGAQLQLSPRARGGTIMRCTMPLKERTLK
ncbi:MAG TPA: ATP-binding protein [Verrucomicrobiae bacterium]|nr:ATP-binding protein [Verrucomicrobiae bacterium]